MADGATTSQGGDRHGGRCGVQGSSSASSSRRRPSPGFVAGLSAAGTEDSYACRLLDAGAGMGAPSDAFLRRWLAGGLACQRVAVSSFQVDEGLRRAGIETVKLCMAFVALGVGCQPD